MKLDRKKRPVSTLSADGRKIMLEQLLGIWNDHPRWGLGQLVAKAASIPSGTRVSVEKASDADIQAGLDALIPMAWEVDELDARPVQPVEIQDVNAIINQADDV